MSPAILVIPLHSIRFRIELTRASPFARATETNGLDPAHCSIYQCCLVFWTTGAAPAPDPRSVVLCTQPTVADGTRIEVTGTERQLLQRIAEIIKEHDPDIMTGYNLTFDNKFISKRLEAHTAPMKGMPVLRDLYRSIGRITPKSNWSTAAFFREQVLQNAAMGTNERVLWCIPGRTVIDLFMYAKVTFPGRLSYKLDSVGHDFVGAGKDPVVFGEILQAFSEAGTDAERGRIATYCLQDGFLCLQLVDKWSAHVSIMQEAAISGLPMNGIMDSGRQVKVIGVILSEILGHYVFNNDVEDVEDAPAEEETGGYQGATVIDTIPGYYNGPCDQVVLLDFAR